MNARLHEDTYAPIQKWLHWIIAFLVFGLVPAGYLMARRYEANIFDEFTNQLSSGHKLTGFIALWLIAARIVVRVKLGAPKPVATLTTFERAASSAVHHLLYILLLLVPLTGWAGVSAYGAREIFGLFSLPPLLPKNEALANVILPIHGALALTMAGLVVLHLAGAAMHGIVKQDGVLNRMIAWWPLRKA